MVIGVLSSSTITVMFSLLSLCYLALALIVMYLNRQVNNLRDDITVLTMELTYEEDEEREEE